MKANGEMTTIDSIPADAPSGAPLPFREIQFQLTVPAGTTIQRNGPVEGVVQAVPRDNRPADDSGE